MSRVGRLVGKLRGRVVWTVRVGKILAQKKKVKGQHETKLSVVKCWLM